MNAQPNRRLQSLQRALREIDAGRYRKARSIAEQVLERNGQDVDALRIAGHAALNDEAHTAALSFLRRAAELVPDHLPTLDGLAAAAEELGETALALRALEVAVTVDPMDPGRYLRLGQIHFMRAENDKAYGYLLIAEQLDPQRVDVARVLGDVLAHLDRNDEALVRYERAMRGEPDVGAHRAVAALALDAVGRTDEADERRREAEALSDGDPEIAFQMKGLRRFSSEDSLFRQLTDAVSAGTIRPDREPLARLTLVKMLDDIGDLSSAAVHLVKANDLHLASLRRRRRAYDAAGHERFVQHLLACHDRAPVHTPATVTPRQMLISGLPRAGKSLLEYLIALHPGVRAIGESRALAQMVEDAATLAGQPFPDLLETLDGAGAGRVGASLAELTTTEAVGHEDRSVNAPVSFVVSAHPGNRAFVALVDRVAADVVLIHCERDPRDLLLANYQQWFPNAQPQTYAVEDLIHHWQMEDLLMAAWEERLGDRFLRVDYEDIVTDPAGIATTVGALLGIDIAAPVRDSVTRLDGDVFASPTDKLHPSRGLHDQHVGMWQRWAPHLPGFFGAIEQSGILERHEVIKRVSIE